MLAMNCGTRRKPDWWLICAEEFTPEELAPHAAAMRERSIALLPDGEYARWGCLYDKATVLETLATLAAHNAIMMEMGKGEQMDIYECKCTCGDDDCTRTLVIEPAFRVSIVDETDELAVAEIMTRDQLLDWVGSDEAGVIQNARNELSIEPDAGAVWQWLDGNEAVAADRAVAEARRERDAAIADAVELRRQVDKLREQLLEAAFIPRFFIK